MNISVRNIDDVFDMLYDVGLHDEAMDEDILPDCGPGFTYELAQLPFHYMPYI